MYNTFRWFIISTVLLVSANAIVSYPAKAFERDSQSGQLIALSLQSFGVASGNTQQDVRPMGAPSYNFSVDYSEHRNEADVESSQPSDRRDLTWKRRINNDSATGAVSIPEPSTLLGLISVSTLFVFKRKSVRKA
jgi:hypothetical protein